MRIKIVIIGVCSLFLKMESSKAQKNKMPSKERTLIQGVVPPGYSGDTIDLVTLPVERITYKEKGPSTRVVRVVKGNIRCELSIKEPLYIKGPLIYKGSKIGYHIEPGDSIAVSYKDNNPIFSGKGASKWELVYRLTNLKDSMESTNSFKSLSGKFQSLKSLDDYFSWNSYLNNTLVKSMELIDEYKSRLSVYTYNVIKERALYEIEEKRMVRFLFLIGNASGIDTLTKVAFNQLGLTNKDLCEIYDTTMNGMGAKWLQFESKIVGDPYYLYEMVKFDAFRQAGRFFKEAKSDTSILGKDWVDTYVVRYNLAKKKYKGEIREEVLAFFFHYVNGALNDIGFDPKIEEILKDYYKQPGFPMYKEAVREYEIEQRKKQFGRGAVDFHLTDVEGRPFVKSDLAGKIAVIDFWFTGCKGCIQMVPALSMIESLFRKDSNVVFLNVSVDQSKEKWIKSIHEMKYTTGIGKNVYTEGKGTEHNIIQNFGVDAYPKIYIMNPYGTLINCSKEDPRLDSGKQLIDLIKRQLALRHDGPYVWGQNNLVKIDGRRLVKEQINRGNTVTFQVQTDVIDNSFSVSLKPQNEEEPCEFGGSKRLLALSDIEGNFRQFRTLLQANGVIDENYNWTFGDGHLVFSGDMFDRGEQVTECLWLIYSLEEKARINGGYVHFILGNHEVMNLQGDSRYVHEKYRFSADQMGTTLQEMYGRNTELGRWLRSKNVVEKIGDLLFAHGGISPELNRLQISIKEINQLTRKCIDKNGNQLKDKASSVVMSQSVSPFWYRGYYNGKIVEECIDTTLSKFKVKHIVTGHTIVSDTISIHHHNKVINTDTKHAEGKSEALLVEDGKFYRVDMQGKRTLLNLNNQFWRKDEYVTLE